MTCLLSKDVQGVEMARRLRLHLVLPLVLAVHDCRVVCIRRQRSLQCGSHSDAVSSLLSSNMAATSLWRPCIAGEEDAVHQASKRCLCRW